MQDLDKLLADIRACRICAEYLPLGPRPVLRVSRTAKLLIIGQAPGTRVHESGVPWDDASGERLRGWLDMKPEVFYDESRVAILPMGLCYPGSNPRGGDNLPRPECAPAWHSRVLEFIPEVKVTLLVGAYAQKHYLGPAAGKTMTETVRAWRNHLPGVFAIPHPSWRTKGWQRKNPWFEKEILPELRRRIKKL